MASGLLAARGMAKLLRLLVILGAMVAPLRAEDNFDYGERMEAVQALGRRFPAFVQTKGFENRRLGIWAGIMLQTQWQLDSGRAQYPIWRHVNETLTLAPHAFSLEYLENPQGDPASSRYAKEHPTRDAAHAPITQVDVCRAWRAFFAAHDEAKAKLESPRLRDRLGGKLDARVKVTRLLWKAHTAAVRHAVWQHAAEFAAPGVPDEEARFWRNWVDFVYVIEKIGAPATDLFARPILDKIMPECSPLGGPGCGLKAQPLVAQGFLRLLMLEKQHGGD